MQIDPKVETEFLSAFVQNAEVVEEYLFRDVDPGFFTVDAYKWFVKRLKEREWKKITVEYLDQELLDVRDDETRDRYRIQLSSLYSRELTFQEDASKKFRAYIAYCVLNAKLREELTAFEKSSRIDLLLRGILDVAGKANEIVQGEKFEVVDYADSFESRVERRRFVRDNPQSSPRVLTGVPGLDSQFTLKAPMIVDFMAPFKRYKSIILNAMSYSALLQGFNVLHVSYENSMDLTTDRFDAMFAELNYDRVRNYLLSADEKRRMDRMFDWMQGWSNRLKVIKCVPKETKVSDIERELKKLRDKEGWTPQVEVWDYLNIVAPSVTTREERIDQGRVVWDLKKHAADWGVLIYEASQANMGGAVVERMDMSHRGKSIDISQALDLSINIDQSEKEKDEGILVLSPSFYRNGAITAPEIILDSDIPKMVIERQLHNLWTHAAKVNPYGR